MSCIRADYQTPRYNLQSRTTVKTHLHSVFFFFFLTVFVNFTVFYFCPGVIVGPACCAAALVDVAVSLVKPPDLEKKQVHIDTGALG